MQTIEPAITPEAEAYLQEVRRRRQLVLSKIVTLPIACLIWEPITSGASMATLRKTLQIELTKCGHLAECNNELINLESPFSELAQQFASLEAFDLVFSNS